MREQAATAGASTTATAGDAIDTDVCVIGAGPAGLALTLMLLRSGVRVTLVERSTAFHRDFHGEILQPGGQRILDELGVLAGAAAHGAACLGGFQVLERERVLLDIDYGRLPAPYDHLLALPQPHLLRELLAACRRLPGFTLLEGHRIAALRQRRPDGPCTGAVVNGPDRVPVTVRAQVVVGADGRFSKTRALAGIDAGRVESFAHDVVWFALHAPGRATGRVRVHRTAGSALLVHDTHPDRLRIGWTLPHGGWRGAVRRGIEDIRRELAEALPPFADLVHEQITAMADLTLLDVFASHAAQWVRDGLVLLGDSAHTHGPIGAQGINLALQDAAALHPVLVSALSDGEPTARRLAAYRDRRAPAAAAVHRMQVMQARTMFGGGGPAADFLRARAAALVTRTPIGAKITRKVAHGHDPAGVRTDLFTPLPAHRAA
ncbi:MULTISPECIES: FAD-dependent monooxygenase [unclassified Streptomyces]|uniref:FAD-dependent monooxygenase n=1 Tax=unclassified Streptomyces TaxID=2593676 RepID=UPI002E0DE98F|nr:MULTISPECIES: FAD-dependent monooxygenase [unclassified Streptomyces]WSR28901.1 FAD-dependent monooxygenase [Streptomyces sp. NBC_01205]